MLENKNDFSLYKERIRQNRKKCRLYFRYRRGCFFQIVQNSNTVCKSFWNSPIDYSRGIFSWNQRLMFWYLSWNQNCQERLLRAVLIVSTITGCRIVVACQYYWYWLKYPINCTFPSDLLLEPNTVYYINTKTCGCS